MSCEHLASVAYFVRGSVGQWRDGRRPSRPRSARVSLDFVGTLFAHLQRHDIPKLVDHAARRRSTADENSCIWEWIEAFK